MNLTFPTSWEGMTPDEFAHVCKILCLNCDRETTLLMCLFVLSRLKWPGKLYDAEGIRNLLPAIHDGKEIFLSTAVLKSACDQLAYILDEIGLPPCPLAGVNRRLYGVSFGQFFEADSYIKKWVTSRSNADLNHAASVLTDGRVKKLKDWQRKAIVIWWNGLINYLMKRFPNVLVEDDSGSSLSQAELLQELLASVNSGKPQENEQILSSETYSVLLALENRYRDAKQRSHN